MSPKKIIRESSAPWDFAVHAKLLPAVPLTVLLDMGDTWSDLQFEMTGSGTKAHYSQIAGEPKRDNWEYEFNGRRVRDGWEVRRRFLSVQTPEEVLRFLNEVGNFFWNRGFSFAAFQSMQRYVERCLMASDTSTWSAKDPNVRELYLQQGVALSKYIDYPPKPWLRLHSDRPVALLVESDAVGAIWATLWLDHFLGARYGSCERSDCRTRFFEITSRHSRKYCSTDCAHVMAVRKSRERSETKQARLREASSKASTRKKGGSHGK